MMSNLVDLHLHTNHSDGEKSVKELVEFIHEKRINVFSITDHDTLAGLDEAKKVSNEMEMIFVPGVEISTYFEGGEVHVLGYFIDHRDEKLRNFISKRFRRRIERAKEMISKLRKMGYFITFEDILYTSPGPYVGRPNIAIALVNKGYIRDRHEAFTDELIGNNGKAYVPPDDCSPFEAIERIKDAGGVPVLAHPGIFVNQVKKGLDERDVFRLKEGGMEGIEVFHSRHSSMDNLKYLKMARKYRMLITVGSDYHYGDNPTVAEMNVDPKIMSEVIEWVRSQICCRS